MRATKVVFDRSRVLTRNDLADPRRGDSHLARLERANAVDLRDNCQTESIGGGYVVARAIDPSKRHSQKKK